MKFETSTHNVLQLFHIFKFSPSVVTLGILTEIKGVRRELSTRLPLGKISAKPQLKLFSREL
jgi:hypothetical protein